jgi:outer membrane immunogenic protein
MLRVKIGLIAAAVLLSGTAMAQNYPSSYSGSSSSTSAQPQFQGLYAGGNIGVGFGEAGPNNTQGFMAGVQAGFKFTADKLVLGVEADVMLTGINAKSYTYTFTQKWLASGRLRLGYQLNSILLYGTGGIAGSTMNFSNFGLSESTNLGGWVAGAGAEMFVTQNISVRGEYLYYSLGQAQFMTLSGPVLATTTTNIVRAGVNYKF